MEELWILWIFFVEKSFSKIIFFRESESDICGNVEDFGFFFQGKRFYSGGFSNCNIFRLVRKKGKVDCSS